MIHGYRVNRVEQRTYTWNPTLGTDSVLCLSPGGLFSAVADHLLRWDCVIVSKSSLIIHSRINNTFWCWLKESWLIYLLSFETWYTGNEKNTYPHEELTAQKTWTSEVQPPFICLFFCACKVCHHWIQCIIKKLNYFLFGPLLILIYSWSVTSFSCFSQCILNIQTTTSELPRDDGYATF